MCKMYYKHTGMETGIRIKKYSENNFFYSKYINIFLFIKDLQYFT